MLCWWWLRSPNSKGDDICCLVYRDGDITFDQVTRSRVAIRPAMNLSSDKERVLLIADKQYEKAYTYEVLKDISITPEGKLETEFVSRR